MLIAFFRSSFIIQYIALIIIAAALWVGAFLHPAPIPLTGGIEVPLFSAIYPWISSVDWLAVPLAFLIILLEAFILNSVMIYHELVPKNSLIPSIVFITFMSSSPVLLNIYPALLAVMLFIIFLNLIIPLYEQENNHRSVLSAGLILSISSMIYFPMVLLLPFFWMCFLIFRILKWREWIISIIAFLIPYLYLAVYYFWTDNLSMAIDLYLKSFEGFLRFHFPIEFWNISIWVMMILFLFIPALGRIMISINSYNINLRKKVSAISWLTIFSISVLFAGGDVRFQAIFLMSLSILISHFFATTKKSGWNEIIFLLLLVGIIVNNFLKTFI